MDILGQYQFSFFCIDMLDEKDLTFPNLVTNPIYLHEYTHFIQDITSVYGWTNIRLYHQDLRNSIRAAYKSPDKRFKIPFELLDDSIMNFIRIYNFTSGAETGTIKSITTIMSVDISNETLGIIESDKSISQVSVKFVDGMEEENELIFGAFCIQEGMANLMESILSDRVVRSDDYPYHFAEKIAHFIYPDFVTSNRLNLLALCDLCLQNHNPGVQFVNFLNEMKSLNWLPKSPEAIYDRFYDANFGTSEAPICLADHIAQNMKSSLDDVLSHFNDHDYFKAIRIWLMTLTCNVVQLRNLDRYFILKIARGGKSTSNSEFLRIHDILGTPNIKNNDGVCLSYFNGHKQDVKYFLAISQIVSIFEKDSTYNRCALYNICKREEMNVDENCITAPWKRSMEHKNLCYFTTIWKHWKLEWLHPFAENE